MDDHRLHRPARLRGHTLARLVYVGTLCFTVTALATLIASCTADRVPIILGNDRGDGAAAPAFTETPDAAADAEAGLTAYCPSSECPPGWTTCPDSRFPCDKDILADSRNCGGCGMTCPDGNGLDGFACIEGACKLQCNPAFGLKDCDGLVDNGCESGRLDPNNCGACGVACDVGVQCVWQDEVGGEVGCGCPAGQTACSGSCVDTSGDDASCGACDNVCDRAGGAGASQYAHAFYGCAASECGHIKCEARYANCDGDIENGCEASTLTNENCGACGRACAPGQQCALDGRNRPYCACAEDGFTFCQYGEQEGLPKGECVDTKTAIGHCGGCFASCTPAIVSMLKERVACDYGKCTVVCVEGHADCNGAESDGCEVDTKSDPRNCGGCGITCDLSIGQACAAGKCVVVPCDQVDAGEVTR